MKTVYLIEKYVFEKETEDGIRYAPFTKEFGSSFWDKFEPETITKGASTNWGGENAPLAIDELEKMLEQAKKKGATHVEIDYHCDHDSYIINGVEIRKATQDEIDKHLGVQTSKEKKALEKKKKNLEKELDNVNSELKK